MEDAGAPRGYNYVLMESALAVHARDPRLRGRAIILAIAFFKLLKGCLMILAAVCALALTRSDVTQRVHEFVTNTDVGPYRAHIGQWIDNKVLNHQVRDYAAVATGAAIYATVFFTEAAGLFFNKRWAEWMVVVSTGLLIPVEISEIYQHHHPLMFVTFVGNVAILIYLIHHVRQSVAVHDQAQRNSTGDCTSG